MKKLLLPVALTLLLLMPGCVPSGRSATEAALCNELRADLPTYSRHDTEKSKAEGARFLTTFRAVCD